MVSSKFTRTAAASALSLAIVLTLALTCHAATEEILHHFAYPQTGSEPLAPLVADASGNLYGSSLAGGPQNLGTIFELSPKAGGGWSETVLHTFSGSDGAYPLGRLRMDKDGNLYGTTEGGGVAPTCPFASNSCGTVFKLSPSENRGWTETVLHSFTGGSDGSFPDHGVNFDASGNIYGSASDGGACDDLGCGKIFKLTNNAGTWTETIVYAFKGGSDGIDPSGVIFDQAGNMYGVTPVGGAACDCGTVFELTPTSDGVTEKVLYTFTGGADGDFPVSDLVLDNSGNLYGTTEFGGANSCNSGCGTVFKLSLGADGWTKTELFAFAGGTDASGPLGRLIYDDGVLYGATTNGGGNNQACYQGCGTIFQLSSASGAWKESILHRFEGADGSNPESIIQDATGHFYGFAYAGGVGGMGVIFQLTHTLNGWMESTVHSFSTVDGDNVYASASGLISDSAGNLYGTTQAGGRYNAGTVFEMMRSGTGWIEKILYSFKGGADGSQPQGTLTFDTAGNLYGVNYAGGIFRQRWCGTTAPLGCGTVFRLTPNGDSWTASTIYTFCKQIECPDGSHPASSLVFDNAGNLYGIADTGGNTTCPDGCGVIFQLTPAGDTWTERVMLENRSYNSPQGLTIDNAGNLYSAAGSEIFEVSNSGGVWNVKNIFSFRGGAAGSYPSGYLIFDGLGNLFGTTKTGGTEGIGTAFMLSPVSGGWQKKTLYSFSAANDESFPNGGLAFDSAGNLYGTTSGGNGTVFELRPQSGPWREVRLHTFKGGTDGIGPNVGVVVDATGNVYGTTGGATSENAGIVFEITP